MQTFFSFFALVTLPLLWASVVMAADLPEKHRTVTIEGWNIRIDERLYAKEQQALRERCEHFLTTKLRDIILVVPEAARLKMQKVTIVLDLSHGNLRPMQYHPSRQWLKANGYSPDLEKCVHLPRAADLHTVRNTREQPWVILHELTHAYHDQVLSFEEPRIIAAYEQYRKSGRGETALLFNGKKVKHYALTNHKEFFAEMTEAYFGSNDFFPFNRAELMTAEPEIYELMKYIWNPPAKK